VPDEPRSGPMPTELWGHSAADSGHRPGSRRSLRTSLIVMLVPPVLALIVLSCVAGIVMLSAAFAGYALAPLRLWERWLIGIAALPTIAPSVTATLAGLALAAPVIAVQIVRARTSPRAAPA
jgi:TRAP-type uncharacterized transport system fused permease subunit